MNNRIKMLQIVDGFRIGGAELKLLELIRNLDRSKYEIIICSFCEVGSLKSDFEDLGLPVFIFSRQHRFGPTAFVKLYKLIRKYRFDIVQTVLFYPDVVGTLVSYFARVPLIISWETVSHNNAFFAKTHRRIMYRFAMKFVSSIVAVSEEIKTSIVKKDCVKPEKIQVIPYGVDLKTFDASQNTTNKDEIGLDAAGPILGVVARLDKVKGHTYLIRAIKCLIEDFPNIKCIFVGDGECRNELEAEIDKLDLRENFILLGFRNDISDLLNFLDIFILPSISEGLPNVVLEAMASSKPVIASNTGGIPEVIENDVNGILVPAKDIEALASAISRLAKDRKLQSEMGKRGRALIEKEFNLNNQISQFETIYKQRLESCGN